MQRPAIVVGRQRGGDVDAGRQGISVQTQRVLIDSVLVKTAIDMLETGSGCVNNMFGHE